MVSPCFHIQSSYLFLDPTRHGRLSTISWHNYRACGKNESKSLTIVNTEAYNSHFIHVIAFLNNLALQFMLRTFITNQKKHCFWICRDEKKSSPWQLQIYFFYLLFRKYSLFFLSLFCLFFIPVFFFLFVFGCSLVSWNWNYIFWYTFDYVGRWLIKKVSPSQFPETRLLFCSPTHLSSYTEYKKTLV